MTPKDKALELFQKFYKKYGYYGIPVDAVKNSKELALICVDEILKGNFYAMGKDPINWQQVKTEIKAL